MERANTTPILLFAGLLFFCACGNSSGNKADASDAKAGSSTVQATSPDINLTGRNGRFSYTINGERVETINYVQHANLFINEVSNDAANGMVKIAVTCSGNNVFDFSIANSGTTTIDNHQPSPSAVTGKKEASYMDGKTSRNLYAVSLTVTITSMDNSRISGTFSGTFKADESDGGATANITSGSFDLPFLKN
ncbi:MAG TPA: hypothetical protein VGQ51_05600 [Puia sp.]|jgi:hypothetical protein|nr:hypothetical protein [Puia sp.]